MAGSVFAEDVLILHQSYGNTHNKWKNRLEDAGHTVTSQTSEPSSFSGYEQVIDLRYSTDANLDTSSDATNQAYKTILAAGGTIVLNGEHSGFANPRNNDIQAFVREVTGDSTITYSTTSSTSGSMATTTVLSTLPSDWSHFNTVAAGIVSDLGDNGKCIAANGSGNCAVALFDGDALSSSYTNGKIVVITDINYASSSTHYTTDNREFLTSLISDVTTSSVNTRSVTLSGITSSQTTEFNTIRNKAVNGNQIYITQTGDGNTLNIGDKVRVRIELRTDRNLEYVHMKDMRASGFEPINVLSSYKYREGLGYYEATKDAATNFFFDYIPKGTYVFEYDLRVQHKGDFSNGITTIQCMYAPEFTSHSDGIRVIVE